MKTINNKKAHQILSMFHGICDDFNKDGLMSLSSGLLKVYQDTTIEALELIKFLKLKDNCEATKSYHIFAGKILIRLSHLIHNNRKETDIEYYEHIKLYL